MLIERDDSLNTLVSLAESAAQGRGNVALVGGEAGIGKTSLLEEFRGRADSSCRFYWGSCEALHTPRPFGPVHDMAESFSAGVKKQLANGAQPAELFTAMLNELQDGSTISVLVFEDIHWADHATLDFVKFLGRRVSMLPALLVISYRDDEVSDGHPLRPVLADLPQGYVRRIELQPLSVDGIQRLGSCTSDKAEDLHQISGGNPFFVTELLALHEHSYSSIPASVKDTVATRLSRLARSERDFLETICVIPGSISPALVQQLFGADGDTWGMACVGRNLLRQDSHGKLRFRHELVRLATLSRLSALQQKTTHQTVLDGIESGDKQFSLDRLVHHAAGALNAVKVLEYAPLAAQGAAGAGAHSEAAAHLGTALRFIDEASPEQAAQLYQDWAYEAGLALRIDDDVLEARRHAITLWRVLDRPDKVGENLRWLSRLHWYRGEAAEASHFADEAIRVLETAAPSVERAMAYSLRSQLHMLNDQMPEAVEWGERALQLADKFDDVEVRIHALNNIGTARVFRGMSNGQQQLQESLDLALKHGLHEHAARVYTNLAEYAVDFWEFELAEQIISAGIAFDLQHDLDAWTHYLVGRLAHLRLKQGRLQDARTIAEGVLKLERLTLLMRLPALIVLAKTQMRCGASDASELLAQALEDAQATDEVQHIVPVRLSLLESAWLDDQPDRAREHYEFLCKLPPSTMHSWGIGELLIWGRRLGFDEPDIKTPELPAPIKAELDGDPLAAADRWESINAPYKAALSLLQYTGQSMQKSLSRALKLLRPLEAEAAINRALAIAAKHNLTSKMPRVRRGPYSAARNHPLGLTKQEQAILRLLTKGTTNREIAAQLNRSPRTVEHHVSSVLGKLNVNNRMEAMLRVQNEPWLVPDNSPEK